MVDWPKSKINIEYSYSSSSIIASYELNIHLQHAVDLCLPMWLPNFIQMAWFEIQTYTDALGIRITVGSFIVLGEFERMRDMLSSALTHWTEDMQLYPYVLGL